MGANRTATIVTAIAPMMMAAAVIHSITASIASTVGQGQFNDGLDRGKTILEILSGRLNSRGFRSNLD